MQINSNNPSAINLNSRLLSLASSMERLSSGARINRAGDDAAGLAISEKMRGQIRGLDMASRNAQDSVSMIKTGEGALAETHDALQRMRELAVQSGNGIYTDADRATLQAEFGQLRTEIDRIGNTTEFNTRKLLDGSMENPAVTADIANDPAAEAEPAGQDNSFTAQIGASSGQTLSVSIGDMRPGALGIEGLDIGTQAGAISSLEAIDAAIERVSSQRGSLGAQQNRLEHTIRYLDVAAENQQAAESRIRDTDMAREVVRRTTDDILRQTSLAMMAQANMGRQGVMQLLS